MSPRNRFLSFGASALLVVISVLVALLVSGVTGEAVSIALGSLGLIAFVSLAFLEVGLSEDRARARENNDRRERTARPPMRPRRRRPD
jgi:hypothetical protein